MKPYGRSKTREQVFLRKVYLSKGNVRGAARSCLLFPQQVMHCTCKHHSLSPQWSSVTSDSPVPVTAYLHSILRCYSSWNDPPVCKPNVHKYCKAACGSVSEAVILNEYHKCLFKFFAYSDYMTSSIIYFSRFHKFWPTVQLWFCKWNTLLPLGILN